jgi:two-component system chemotaxis response regulator CheB
MPQGFTRSFAERLARTSSVIVSEAHDGQKLQPHHIYVAPGGQHTTVRKTKSGDSVFDISASEPTDFYSPSANRLLKSLADSFGPGALGIVLTGMGDDGLDGARAVKGQGGSIVVESRESAAIWGMPRAVVEARLADVELSQPAIAAVISLLCETSASAA